MTDLRVESGSGARYAPPHPGTLAALPPYTPFPLLAPLSLGR